MALSFSSSVTLRDRRKTFVRPVESSETAEPLCRVLPPEPFRQSLRSSAHHDFSSGERVVLLSLTADGWIHSGFKGTILSVTAKCDANGRRIPRAHVEWDEGVRHPSRISVHAVSRLRLLNNDCPAF